LIPDWTYFHCPGATLAIDWHISSSTKSNKRGTFTFVCFSKGDQKVPAQKTNNSGKVGAKRSLQELA